jgi:hypothetical protein
MQPLCFQLWRIASQLHAAMNTCLHACSTYKVPAVWEAGMVLSALGQGMPQACSTHAETA